MRASCPQAVAARLGGDEFVLYWDDRSLDFLISTARLLIEQMGEVFSSSETLRLIAPSIGIVHCDKVGLTLDELSAGGMCYVRSQARNSNVSFN